MAATLPYFSLPAVIAVSLLLLRAVYRMALHPLAKFPGPKLAALSSAYQAWFDLRPGTSYIFQFPELHKKYGKTCEARKDQVLMNGSQVRSSASRRISYKSLILPHITSGKFFRGHCSKEFVWADTIAESSRLGLGMPA